MGCCTSAKRRQRACWPRRSNGEIPTLSTGGSRDVASETLKAGDLVAVVGDNEAADKHRAGYNGLWSLTHTRQPQSPFVPTVAGMNLEHIFDGDKDGDAKIFFEPR